MYARLSSSHIESLLDYAGVGNRSDMRVYCYALRFSKPGDRLNDLEHTRLCSWLARHGYDASDDYRATCVQLTLKQVADDLFHGSKARASRNIEKLVEAGLFHRVMDGFKGHGSLYVIDFFNIEEADKTPDEKPLVAENAPKQNQMCDETEKGCVFPKKVATNGGLVAFSNELVALEHAVTCGNDDVLILTNTNSYKRSEEKQGKGEVGVTRCSHCGSTRGEVISGTRIFECFDCGGCTTVSSKKMKGAAA